VLVNHSRCVGRATKILDASWLQDAVSGRRRLKMNVIASLLGIHQNTLHYKLRQMGLYHRFTNLSDHDLDVILKIWKHLRPSSSLRYATGFLRRHGLRIQRECVHHSMRQIDGLGQELRCHDSIMRHEYVSHLSNAVWHFNGMHKPILWGFVVHGGVDGHDHMVSTTIAHLPSMPTLLYTGCCTPHKCQQPSLNSS
jgi:hypothetical protein